MQRLWGSGKGVGWAYAQEGGESKSGTHGMGQWVGKHADEAMGWAGEF